MKPVSHDFDVITDAPAPQRRAPDAAEKAPRPDAQAEQRSAAPPQQEPRINVQAAE